MSSTTSWRGFYRFIYDSWATVSSSPTFNTNAFPTVQNSFAGPGIDMVANLTYAASPSLVNEFVADYTTDHITLTNISPGIGRRELYSRRLLQQRLRRSVAFDHTQRRDGL